MPNVTSSSVVSNNISFTGTNFFTSGYTPFANYAGVNADTVTINSATDAVATFNYGVPYNGLGSNPILFFVSTTSNAIHWASVSSALINMQPSLSTSATTCSFAGGCLYTVSANGLATTLSNSTRS